MKVRKMTLNEAIELKSSMPNVDEIAENPKTHFDLTGIGPAYVDSNKLHKRTEDDMKEKNKETDEFEKEYSDEKSKDRIKTERLHLSESLFDDEDLEEKTVIYQFPKFTAEDRSEARRYGLEIVRETKEDTFAKGRKEDIEDFADEFLGYELNPEYMIEESLGEDKDSKPLLKRGMSLEVGDRVYNPKDDHPLEVQEITEFDNSRRIVFKDLKTGERKRLEVGHIVLFNVVPDSNESLTEDTVKTKSGKWVNKGDTGETHGEFKTKKAADEQRKAIFARGWKKESLEEDYNLDLNREVYNALSDIIFDRKQAKQPVSKDDVEKAIEWFSTHFWDDERDYDGDESLDESLKEAEEKYETLAKISNGLEVIKYPYGFAVSDGYRTDKIYVKDDDFQVEDEAFKLSDKDKEIIRKLIKSGVIVEESLTEARKKPEENEEFNDYDMYAFITNLFVKDKSSTQIPLDSIGGWDEEGRELSISNEGDAIILGTNEEKDFDKVREVCDKLDLGHRDIKNPNGKFKFYHEIDIPTDDNGDIMRIEDYFEEVGIDLADVMPSWYLNQLRLANKRKEKEEKARKKGK